MNNISNVEIKTAQNGNEYKVATVNGKKYVRIFSSFAEYDQVVNGAQVGGFVKTGEYNGKPSYTLENDKQPSSGGKQNTIAQAQNRKNEFIKESQESKNAAIEISSTFRDATLLTIAECGEGVNEQTLKRIWMKWRAWLLDQYSKDPRETMTSPDERGNRFPVMDDYSHEEQTVPF